MAGHMHFNLAGHACDSETTVKQKTSSYHTNTTHYCTGNPFSVPLAWKFYAERIIIQTHQLSNALFMFFVRRAGCFLQIHGLAKNPTYYHMILSSLLIRINLRVSLPRTGSVPGYLVPTTTDACSYIGVTIVGVPGTRYQYFRTWLTEVDL